MAKLIEYIKVAEVAKMLGVAQSIAWSCGEAGKIQMHRNPANGHRLF